MDYFANQRICSHLFQLRHHLWRSVEICNLRRVTVNQSLTYVQFALLDLTKNPDDLKVLTPGHFLFGTSLTTIILTEVNPGRLRRFKLISHVFQYFWNRLAKDYLTQLQQSSKWRGIKTNIKVDDLVLLKDENLPPIW